MNNSRQSTESHSTNTAQWVDQCWQDMQARAAQNQAFCAEDYITQGPEVTDDTLVDLVYAEYLVRVAAEKPLPTEAYLSRFPHLADKIRRQLELDQTIIGIDPELSLDGSKHSGQSAQTIFTDRLVYTPDQVGRYRIIQRLPSGGQADVFRAFDPELERDVIIKWQKQELHSDQAQRILDEGKITSQFEHPRLASTLDVGVHDNRPYLVTKFYNGVTFDQWVRSNRPTEAELRTKVADLARALQIAHDRGVWHLDIKPRNVIVSQDNQLNLIDFGIASASNAALDLRIKDGETRGSLQFMAPEQANGEADKISHLSDIFGLGGLLLFGSTLHPVFVGSDTREFGHNIKNNLWNRPELEKSSCSGQLKEIIVRALASDSADRFRSCDELADALHSSTVAASDLTSVARADSEGNRHQKFGNWIGLALAVTLIGAILSMALLFNRDPQSHQPLVSSDSRLAITLIDPMTETASDIELKDDIRTGQAIRCSIELASHAAGILFTLRDGQIEELQAYEAAPRNRNVSYPEQASEALPLLPSDDTDWIGLCTGADLEAIREYLNSVAWQIDFPADSSQLFVLHDQDVTSKQLKTPKLDALAQLAGDSRALGAPVEIDSSKVRAEVYLSELGKRASEQGLRLDAIVIQRLY